MEVPMLSKTLLKGAFLALFLTLCSGAAFAQKEMSYVPGSAKQIPAGSTVFVDPMPGGFETYLVAGLVEKKVPLIVVNDIRKADYEISGVSESDKASWAKMFFMNSERSSEQASIKIVNLKTGEVVFGYSVHKGESFRGKQSAAEACAKHLKKIVTQ
jgi:hypothetical protein